MFFFSKRKI